MENSNLKASDAFLAYLRQEIKAAGDRIIPVTAAKDLNLNTDTIEALLEDWRDDKSYKIGWVTKKWRFIDRNDESYPLDENEAICMLNSTEPLRHPETRVTLSGNPKHHISCIYLATRKFYDEQIAVEIKTRYQTAARHLVNTWLRKTFTEDDFAELRQDSSYFLLEQMIVNTLEKHSA